MIFTKVFCDSWSTVAVHTFQLPMCTLHMVRNILSTLFKQSSLCTRFCGMALKWIGYQHSVLCNQLWHSNSHQDSMYMLVPIVWSFFFFFFKFFWPILFGLLGYSRFLPACKQFWTFHHSSGCVEESRWVCFDFQVSETVYKNNSV